MAYNPIRFAADLVNIFGFMQLQSLYMNDCGMSGDVNVIARLPGLLSDLNLKNNRLSGQLKAPPGLLLVLDLSNNTLTGPVPKGAWVVASGRAASSAAAAAHAAARPPASQPARRPTCVIWQQQQPLCLRPPPLLRRGPPRPCVLPSPHPLAPPPPLPRPLAHHQRVPPLRGR